MDGTIPPDRSRGTTGADLRACVRFVFCRPGWSVEEGTDGRCEARILVSTPGGHWRIMRAESGLVLISGTSGKARSGIATLKEALVLLWEADGRPSAA